MLAFYLSLIQLFLIGAKLYLDMLLPFAILFWDSFVSAALILSISLLASTDRLFAFEAFQFFFELDIP